MFRSRSEADSLVLRPMVQHKPSLDLDRKGCHPDTDRRILHCYGSGIRCLFDPWIRDPGWIKSQDPDPG
jgi:hypothetical protein